ncbi:MAG: hypothetical protein L3J74_02325 [Bacteroidales bacterium]|nr:hypothetical protein [Bacteroidales bacterium]
MRFLLLILFSISFALICAQNDTHVKIGKDSKAKVESSENQSNQISIKTNKKDDFAPANFVFQLGAWIPVDYLKNTFDINTNYALRFGIKLRQNMVLQLGMSFFVPKTSNDFKYLIDSVSYTTKSSQKTNGFIGAWINHSKLSANKNILFEKYIGIGSAFIQTDIPNPKAKNDRDKYYSVRAVNLNFGFAINKITRSITKWGWFIEYNFAPYYASRHVSTMFGNSNVITGLQFSL